MAEKCCCVDLSSVLDPLTGWLPKGVLKQEFYGIQVTTFFGMKTFGNIEVMKVIIFSKCWKFYVEFQNAVKPPENLDRFEDNCAWSCCWSFTQLWEEYMWWSVNVSKSAPRISDPNRRHDKKLPSFDINGTLA